MPENEITDSPYPLQDVGANQNPISTSAAEPDVSWLCDPGPYQNYIKKLCWSIPGFKYPDPANTDNMTKPSLKPGNAKVCVLESPAQGGTRFRRVPDFRSIADVQAHFNQRRSTGQNDKNRVYFVEGLAPDFIAAIGDYFMMDPSFWLRQERTCPWSNNFTPTSDALPPPTMLDPDTMFVMQYCELREFDEALSNNPRFCDRTGRHVGMTAARTKTETTVAILRRKVSWWCRKPDKNGPWDAVILCDPVLDKLKPGGNGNDNAGYKLLSNHPFQGGYVDFLPPPSHEEATTWPQHPHGPMLEDLCHYFLNHSSILEDRKFDWQDPTTSTVFLKKVVAAQYLQLIDYIKVMLPSLELRLTRSNLTQGEEQWNSLQTINRRCGNYQDDIEDILLSLGYPAEPTIREKGRVAWEDCCADFQQIHYRLKVLKGRADTLLQSMTGLASIAGNRQSLDEAKRVKRLTLLGLVFIPLAYTSALFSMQDNYAPGKRLFWVYWASALGLVVLTFTTTYILDKSMNEAAEFKLEELKLWGKKKKEAKLRNNKTQTGFWH